MTSNILRTTATAAIADPVTKHHMEKMADATALALFTTTKNSKQQTQHLQNLDKEERAFGFRRQQQQIQHGNNIVTRKLNKNYDENNNNQDDDDIDFETKQSMANWRNGKFQFQTKVSKNLLDETSLILNPQFLGNVAAQYQPPIPAPFVPVSALSSSIGKSKRKNNNNKLSTNNATSSDGESLANNNNHSNQENATIQQKPLPEAISSSIPPLDVAAPARNLCIELLATRIVSCVKAVSVLLQEFSSSPGQSLPHVAVLGPGNVGHTVLTHLVKLLPADRIVILARDSKSPVCNQFSTKYGVRALSTNILRDERLVDVIKTHRNKMLEDALKKQRDAGLDVAGSGTRTTTTTKDGQTITTTTKAPFFGASNTNNNNHINSALFSSATSSANNENSSSSSASHVAPEVAAAQHISVALQQIHVLVLCCRPAQLNEVAASLQPWLRSSSVVVLSTLVGVTADRIAALFKVPSSLSVTVDTNEMIYDFETRSRLHARTQENAAAAAKLLRNLSHFGNNNNNEGGGKNNDKNEKSFKNHQQQSVVGVLMNMNRAEAALSVAGSNSPKSSHHSTNQNNTNVNNNSEDKEKDNSGAAVDHRRALQLLHHQQQIAQEQQNQLRFFTREPLDFLHRFYFALVSTLLERCGVGPQEAWLGVAKLLLGHNSKVTQIQLPKGIGAQGPGLVAKCSVQILATAVGMSVGEVMRIADEKMVQFATAGK